MEKTFVGIRDVDKQTFQKFRATAVAQRMKLGEALTKAMKLAMECPEKDNLPNPANLLNLKPVGVGKKVKWSEEVDEILYGLEK